LNRFAPVLGALGLVVDLAFHWAATADPSNVPEVMRTLLVDTDLSQDAWRLTLLGVSAHLIFLVAFLYLLVGSASGRRSERNTPAADFPLGWRLHGRDEVRATWPGARGPCGLAGGSSMSVFSTTRGEEA
jgi:hypothetical protein